MTEVDAWRPAFILDSGDRGVGRPPVPTELVHGLGEARAALAECQRRHRRLLRWIGRIARQARHTGHAFVFREERLKSCVVDRPVIGDTVERPNAEVGWMQTWIVRRIYDGAATDAVEVQHLDW